MEPCLELPAPQKTALSLSFSIKTIAFDYGGGCNGIVLTKNRDCLSFFTNCALLLGPVPNLRKALHRHYHHYIDNDIHQTTEALSIISSIIRPGSSPSSSTFLTCNWSRICRYLVDNFSSSEKTGFTTSYTHLHGFIQRHPKQHNAHRISLLAGSLPFSYPVHEMLLRFPLKEFFSFS